MHALHVSVAVAVLLLAAACAPPLPDAPPSAEAPAAASTPALLQPMVTMAADPAPPFTYWAPEGSTVRNHPNVPGLWIAEGPGRSSIIYFGDQCGASRLQHFVGQPLQSFAAPDGAEVRTFCTTCAHNDDLRPNRINVAFDETTQSIATIACH